MPDDMLPEEDSTPAHEQSRPSMHEEPAPVV